jgi:hypothetical protein
LVLPNSIFSASVPAFACLELMVTGGAKTALIDYWTSNGGFPQMASVQGHDDDASHLYGYKFTPTTNVSKYIASAAGKRSRNCMRPNNNYLEQTQDRWS